MRYQLKMIAGRHGMKGDSLPDDEESLRKIVMEKILPADETYQFMPKLI
jgi:hypothetical protein